jgi:hypothetical protein
VTAGVLAACRVCGGDIAGQGCATVYGPMHPACALGVPADALCALCLEPLGPEALPFDCGAGPEHPVCHEYALVCRMDRHGGSGPDRCRLCGGVLAGGVRWTPAGPVHPGDEACGDADVAAAEVVARVRAWAAGQWQAGRDYADAVAAEADALCAYVQFLAAGAPAGEVAGAREGLSRALDRRAEAVRGLVPADPTVRELVATCDLRVFAVLTGLFDRAGRPVLDGGRS